MASLLCYGSHSKDIEAIWLRVRPENALAIYDDDPETGLYAPPADLTGRILVGINNPSARRKIVERFGHLRGTHSLVDPSAVLGVDIRLGRGVVVAPTASLLRSVTLEAHVHVNTAVSLTRCLIRAYSTISPGATICGDVEIGKECWIGANATICDRVTIGNNVTVAAGAIVPPTSVVPDNAKVIGVWKG